MKYIVKYKIKWEKTTNEESYKSKKQIINIVRQLQRWIMSLNSKIIISNLEDFDIFQIIEQNYDQKNENWKCITIEISKDWEPDITEIDVPIQKDITNEIFDERKVSSVKIWNIYLHNKFMTIYWEMFPLGNNTKIRDIFEILIILKHETWNNKIEYTDILRVFNEKQFKNLKKSDINSKKIWSLMKDKLIKVKKELKKDILTITTEYIKIN